MALAFLMVSILSARGKEQAPPRKTCRDYLPSRPLPKNIPNYLNLTTNAFIRKGITKVQSQNPPIYRWVGFEVAIQKVIFDELFSDLSYAVEMAVKHAKRPYTIQKVENHYKAYDGLKTWADIYPIQNSKKDSTYIYYIAGHYDTFVKIHGSMIMDVRFVDDGLNGTKFDINAYISIDNPLMRGVAGLLQNIKSFESYINNIIDCTVLGIWRTGYTVGRAIKVERYSR